MALALPLIALAFTAAGTGVAVSSSMQQAQAAKDTAKFNSDVENNNAIAASQQAQAEATQIQRQNRLRAGSQRAAYGKAGVDISSGQDVMNDSGTQGELEKLSTLYAGQTQASYYQSRGVAARFEGANTARAAGYQAAGSIISGAAQGVGIYAQYKRDQAARGKIK